jgi:virginiamycin B lyase
MTASVRRLATTSLAAALTAALLLGSTLVPPAGAVDPLGEITVVATEGTTPGFEVDQTVYSITEGPDGLLWLTDYDSVLRRNADGSFTDFSAGIDGDSLSSITTGPDGNLWFAEFNPPGRIGRITPTGTVTEMAVFGVTPGFTDGNVQTITAGPDGNLWFTKPFNGDNGRVGRITPAGVVTEFTPPYDDAEPRGIVAGPDGNLWFTDSGTGRVVKLGTDGTFTDVAVSGVTPGFDTGPSLGPVTVGPDGNLWLLAYSAPAVVRVTPAGQVTQYTTAGLDVPESIASACGSLWVTQIGYQSAPGIWQVGTDGAFTDWTSSLPDDTGPSVATPGPDDNLWLGAERVPQITDDGTSYVLRMGAGCTIPPPPTTPTTPTTATPTSPTTARATAATATPRYTG